MRYRPPESDASRLCRRDTLRLPLTYEFPFRLSDIAEYLQHEIGDERTGQVALLLAGVQQRDVENNDRGLPLLGDDPLLLQYLIIVPPEPVDTFDDNSIAGLQLSDETSVRRPVKILSGPFVGENTVVPYPELSHGDELPVLILFTRRNADIAVNV